MTQEIDTNLFDQNTEDAEGRALSPVIKSAGQMLAMMFPQITDQEVQTAVDKTGLRELVRLIHSELEPLVVASKEMVVVDEPSYQQAMALANRCSKASKLVVDKIKEKKGRAYDFWKSFTTLEGAFTNPMDTAKALLNKKGTRWYDAEMKRRRDEAERVRKEKEKADEEERLRVAEKLAASGNTKLADAVLEETTYIAPEPVEVPIASGSTRVPKWTFEVTDIMALLRAVVEGKAPAALVQVNTVLLGQMARNQKEAALVPGVRFFDEGTIRHA
jgi:hypothetical protein